MNYGAQDFIAINAQSVGEYLGISLDARGAERVTYYITGAGTVSSGILTYEENTPDGIASGAGWSAISTTDFSSASVGSGATAAVHLTAAGYSIIRPHITTVIGGGGTITVRCVAQ